jgi:UDPglucose--hexose-1-phosphate uridylyltransferase
MPQFRKDIFSDAWIMISPERGLEASVYGSVRPNQASPLSPGNEASLGHEVRALRPQTSRPNSPDWRIRVVNIPNALVSPQAFEVEQQGLYQQATNYGYQELVIEHPDAHMTLETMPHEHVLEVLKVYQDRLAYMASKPDINHIQLIRSVGKSAGALYDHPHGQVLGLPVRSSWLEQERHYAEAYFQREGRNLFEDIWRTELTERERLITYNDAFVALAPFASKQPFETWLLPRQSNSSFTALASNVMPLLVEILQTILTAFNSALNHPPYTMLLHSLPKTGVEGYDWHIKLLPRLTQSMGFDWGSGFYTNPTPPEDAARFLREAILIQGVVS